MATHKSIKIGIISFVLVAVALGLGLGLGLGAKSEEGRAGSVQGSLAKEVDKLDSIGAIDCAGRRALIVPGVEDLVPGVEDYGTPGYVRRLATEATAPVECDKRPNVDRCVYKRARRNLGKESESGPPPTTVPTAVESLQSASPVPSSTRAQSPAPTICEPTSSPTAPLTTLNPSSGPTTPAPTPGPTTPEPTTLSPTTMMPTTLLPTPGPTSGSTPTVSTEVTGPPTKGDREPL